MPQVYAIDGIVPLVEPSAYVHPSAVLIGDVIVAARAYIGPCASRRGDFGRIVVEKGANVQDHCTMHGFPGDGHRGRRGVEDPPRRHPPRLSDSPGCPHRVARHARRASTVRRFARARCTRHSSPPPTVFIRR